MGTTAPLDCSTSAPEHMPTEQTPLKERIGLPLLDTETPVSLPAYNPANTTTSQTGQRLSGAGEVTPTQPPTKTGDGTPLQSSVGQPVPVTLNTAPDAVAAPVPLEQIMRDQQAQEQQQKQELIVPQNFASATSKRRGRGLEVTITQNTPRPAELRAMTPRKYVPRPAGRNLPID